MQRQIHNVPFAIISVSIRSLAVALMAIAALTPLSAAHAQLQWDGDCQNAFWHSTCGNPPFMTNWQPNQIPGNGDDVTIGGTVVHIFGLGANCGSITCTSGLNITNGGQLYCHGTGGSVQNLTMTNASLGCAQGGTLELSGSSATNGGAVYGPGEMHNTGTLSGLSLTLRNNPAATFLNQGGQMTISSIQIEPGATLKNIGGTLTLTPHQQVNGGGINASSGGSGQFINEGEFITQHDGTAHSQFTIAPTFRQNSGAFRVLGQSGQLGTIINNNATFNGGLVNASEGAILRFWGGTHEFNGLSHINGYGTVYLQLTSAPGPEWLVSSALDVSMFGDTGMFIMDTGRITLHDTLNFFGKALWKGMTIQRSDCTACDSKFRNTGEVTIDTGAPSNAVNLDATFENTQVIRHTQGKLIFHDDAHLINGGSEGGNTVYRLTDGDIIRQSPETLSEFVNPGTLWKTNLPETQDSEVTVVFRNQGGGVWVDKARLTFGQGCLRLEGGLFSTSTQAEAQSYSEIMLTGNTHMATSGLTRFLGTGIGRLWHGTLRVDSGAEVQTDLSHSNPDAVNGFILDANSHMGGTGIVRNMGGSRLLWKQGTVGVTDGAGGFDANVINEGITIINGGTATVKGSGSTFTSANGSIVDQFSGHLFLDGGLVINRGRWFLGGGSMSVGGSGGRFINEPGGESVPPRGEDDGNEPPEGTNTNGLFQCDVEPDQTVTVSCEFDNRGAVSVIGGSLIFGGPIAQLQNGVLNGGTWLVGPEGSLALPGTLNAIGPDAFVYCLGEFTDLQTLQSNQGTLQASGQTIDNGFINEGTVSLTPPKGGSPALSVDGEVNNSPLAYMDNQVVLSVAGGTEGASFIALECDALDNNGTLAPGGTGAPGTFSMVGNFNQSATGVLDIDLGGLAPGDEHDQLIVDGDVLLGGHLNVRVLPGYTPEGGEQFTIVTASNGTIFGTFDQIDGSGQYSVSYSPTSVTLMLIAPPQPGDTNGDGSVDVDDLINVILGWGACPAPPTFCAADLDGNGAVDVDDLIIVILNWG